MLSFALNILLVILLGITIFYAWRLSKHMDVFVKGRADLDKLVRDLAAQVTRAQEAITSLDDAAADATKDLINRTAKARELADELQLMTEAGNSLAERLEGLASSNRRAAEDRPIVKPYTETLSAVKPQPPKAPSMPAEPFSIRDPDFEAGSHNSDDFSDDNQSEAERALAEALRRKNQKGTK